MEPPSDRVESVLTNLAQLRAQKKREQKSNPNQNKSIKAQGVNSLDQIQENSISNEDQNKDVHSSQSNEIMFEGPQDLDPNTGNYQKYKQGATLQKQQDHQNFQEPIMTERNEDKSSMYQSLHQFNHIGVNITHIVASNLPNGLQTNQSRQPRIERNQSQGVTINEKIIKQEEVYQAVMDKRGSIGSTMVQNQKSHLTNDNKAETSMARTMSILQDRQSASQRSQTLGPRQQSSTQELKHEMVSKAKEELAQQERSYMQVRNTLHDFKDGSVSAHGRIVYATSSIPHQHRNLKKGFKDQMKEHQRTLSVEELEIIHVDDEKESNLNKCLSKVTQDKLQSRWQEEQLKTRKKSMDFDQEGHEMKHQVETGQGFILNDTQPDARLIDQQMLYSQKSDDQRMVVYGRARTARQKQLDSQTSAPLLTMRIQQAKIQSQLDKFQPVNEYQDNTVCEAFAQTAGATIYQSQGRPSNLNPKSSILNSARQFRSPFSVKPHLRRNHSQESNAISIKSKDSSLQRATMKSSLVMTQTDFQRLKPIAVAAPQARKKTLQYKKKQVLDSQIDRGCSPFDTQNQSIESQFKGQTKVQAGNIDSKRFSNNDRSETAAFITQRQSEGGGIVCNQNLRNEIVLSSNLAKTEYQTDEKLMLPQEQAIDLVNKQYSHRSLLSPMQDKLDAQYAEDLSINQKTIYEELPTPPRPVEKKENSSTTNTFAKNSIVKNSRPDTDRDTKLLVQGDPRAQLELSIRKPVERNQSQDQESSFCRHHNLIDAQQNHAKVIISESTPEIVHESPAPQYQHSAYPQISLQASALHRKKKPTNCKLRLQKEIKEFQLKQKRYKNFLVFNMDPDITLRHQKNMNHNQYRLQSMFGQTANRKKADSQNSDEKIGSKLVASDLQQQYNKSIYQDKKYNFTKSAKLPRKSHHKSFSSRTHNSLKDLKSIESDALPKNQSNATYIATMTIESDKVAEQKKVVKQQTEMHAEYGCVIPVANVNNDNILSPQITKKVTIGLENCDRSSMQTSMLEKDNAENSISIHLQMSQNRFPQPYVDQTAVYSFTNDQNLPDTAKNSQGVIMMPGQNSDLPLYFGSQDAAFETQTQVRIDERQQQTPVTKPNQRQIVFVKTQPQTNNFSSRKVKDHSAEQDIALFPEQSTVNGFKTRSQRKEIQSSRIDQDSGLSIRQSKRSLNVKDDLIIRPLTGGNIGGRRLVSQEKVNQQSGGSPRIMISNKAQQPNDLYQINPAYRTAQMTNQNSWRNLQQLPKCETFTQSFLMVASASSDGSGDESQTQVQSQMPQGEYTSVSNMRETAGFNTALTTQNFKIFEGHSTSSTENLIDIKHQELDIQNQTQKRHKTARQMSQAKKIQMQTQVLLKPTQKGGHSKKLGKMHQSKSNFLFATPQTYSTTRTMYNTFKSQKAAQFTNHASSHHQKNKKILSCILVPSSIPKLNQTSANQFYETKTGVNHVTNKVSNGQTKMAIRPSTGVQNTQRILHNQHLAQKMQKSVSRKRQKSQEKLFPSHQKMSTHIITNQEALNNSECAVETEIMTGSQPMSVVISPDKRLFKSQLNQLNNDYQIQSQQHEIMAASQEKYADLRADSSSEQAEVNDYITQQKPNSAKKGATSLEQITQIKFTPQCLSPKSQESSSCIFKGSQPVSQPIRKSSSKEIQTSIDRHNDQNWRSRIDSDVSQLESKQTLPKQSTDNPNFSSKEFKKGHSEQDLSTKRLGGLRESKDGVIGRDHPAIDSFVFTTVDEISRQKGQNRNMFAKIGEAQELQGQTMPLAHSDSNPQKSFSVAATSSSNLGEHQRIPVNISPTKVQITIKNENPSSQRWQKEKADSPVGYAGPQQNGVNAERPPYDLLQFMQSHNQKYLKNKTSISHKRISEHQPLQDAIAKQEMAPNQSRMPSNSNKLSSYLHEISLNRNHSVGLQAKGHGAPAADSKGSCISPFGVVEANQQVLKQSQQLTSMRRSRKRQSPNSIQYRNPAMDEAGKVYQNIQSSVPKQKQQKYHSKALISANYLQGEGFITRQPVMISWSSARQMSSERSNNGQTTSERQSMSQARSQTNGSQRQNKNSSARSRGLKGINVQGNSFKKETEL